MPGGAEEFLAPWRIRVRKMSLPVVIFVLLIRALVHLGEIFGRLISVPLGLADPGRPSRSQLPSPPAHALLPARRGGA